MLDLPNAGLGTERCTIPTCCTEQKLKEKDRRSLVHIGEEGASNPFSEMN